jgi:hypothetical protein
MSYWETLQRLMPPPSDRELTVDWDALSRSWGRAFPSDYRQFMTVYGAGSIQNFLQIVSPELKEAPSGPGQGGMVQETATAELLWTQVRRSPELADADPLLISWAASAGADSLCWDASGDHPDRWPVLVVARGDAIWRRYDCGMVEFLARTLQGDFDRSPLSGTDVWGIDSALFLTPGEERRRLRAGLDPWTGEPDPYAGMYPSS